MFIFKLPFWISNEIDIIHRDFLWKGPELGPKGMHLIAWSRICIPCKSGGWGILNIHDFNRSLLGKWWWSIITYNRSYWFNIINFNYLIKGPLLNLCFTYHWETNPTFVQELHPWYLLSDFASQRLLRMALLLYASTTTS